MELLSWPVVRLSIRPSVCLSINTDQATGRIYEPIFTKLHRYVWYDGLTRTSCFGFGPKSKMAASGHFVKKSTQLVFCQELLNSCSDFIDFWYEGVGAYYTKYITQVFFSYIIYAKLCYVSLHAVMAQTIGHI